VSGAPINCKLYSAVSVQIRVSCLARNPPIICDPEESLKDPAVFVHDDLPQKLKPEDLVWEED
jgi:hypothetical protein